MTAERFAPDAAPRFPHRLERLRARIAAPDRTPDGQPVAEATEALLVTEPENARYLTGFTGSNGIALVAAGGATLFTDGRYALQSAQQVPGWERVIVPQGTPLLVAAGALARERGLASLAVEGSHLSVNAFRTLEGAAEGIRLVPRDGLVESVRAIKDADELAAIRRATALVDAGWEFLTGALRVGRTEREIAWELEVFFRTHGASRLAFDSILGSGPQSALIHGRPSDRRLGESGGAEFVLCDFGCVVDGYCADLTRTVVVGGAPTEAMRAQYEAVRAVQAEALAALGPGVLGRAVDARVRERLREGGWGELPHGLGHGLGRVVHDPPLPALSPAASLTLAPGMVVTVEPGIYLESQGGVRIEDDVHITENGIEVLTHAPKELLCL